MSRPIWSQWQDPPILVPGIAPRRYGGDKLAFAPVEEAKTCGGEDANLVDAIRKAIDGYRRTKQETKKSIERKKEELIRDAGTEAAKKRILRWYHYNVLVNAGWDWETRPDQTKNVDNNNNINSEIRGLKDVIKEALSGRGFIEEVRQGVDGGHAFIRCQAASHPLYTIYFGRSRFPAAPTLAPPRNSLPANIRYRTDDMRNIYVKIGHEKDTSGYKHFVLDANGVMTHRYVTRAFLVYNLATMFGFRLIPPGEEPYPHSDEAKLLPHLLPRAAARICRTTMRIEPPLIKEDAGLAEQLARYTGDTFGGHADVFDIRRAASYEPDGLLNPDFTPYRRRGTVKQEFMPRTGLTLVTGFCEERVRTDPLERNERASMQVRNGSGADQPYLSTAAVLHDYKVIRANKGERFDDTAENQGTFVIDLAIAKLMGVEIINQYAVESDRFKIAYDRYYDKGDAVRIERKVALRLLELAQKGLGEIVNAIPEDPRAKMTTHLHGTLAELVSKLGSTPPPGVLESLAGLLAEIGVRPKDIGVEDGDMKDLRDEDLKQLMALQGDKFDHKSIIKRTAAQELEEYIASARKNREILMDRIPIECIVKVRLNPDSWKWPGADKFTQISQARQLAVQRAQGSQVPDNAWVPFGDAFQSELREYLTGDAYSRTKEMFMYTVAAKRDEDLAAKKNVT